MLAKSGIAAEEAEAVRSLASAAIDRAKKVWPGIGLYPGNLTGCALHGVFISCDRWRVAAGAMLFMSLPAAS